ncbi:F0F1 ATP synthase subunit alpha [Patescibacteria group bacterium]|nr:F0F1 ATP synthase subunit alpha [Patescibacteria group bacterium]
MNKLLNSQVDKLINKITFETDIYSLGVIESLGDGICLARGLKNAMFEELVVFPNGTAGVVFDLKENQIGIIILGDYQTLKEGDQIRTTGKVLSIPVSEAVLGRVVNPLMLALDGRGEISSQKLMPLEKIAPGIVARQSVDTPLQTGIKAVDSMIPIGRGQRELIIGDRGTGKTAIAIDTIINQQKEKVVCIYVSIGQKSAKLARIIDRLKESDALDYTVIVSANAADPAALQYLAPYAGCAIGEYFMEQGKDVLLVYDDLTKHAWAYRQLSLLLRRPSGREAYPGDLFYLHSRLLERACKLNKNHGGGSLTALPIIETQDNDVSAYVPTNVISITDGQIYLESDLFYAGIRPAINTGLSVSRVGGAAQIKAMKRVAGQLRLDMAQYRELAAFAQFTTDLDEATQAKIDRGSRLAEILKQSQYQPIKVELQVVILWAATSGYLDTIPINLVSEFENQLFSFMAEAGSQIIATLNKNKTLDQSTENDLKALLDTFQETFINQHGLKETNQEGQA